ncbi:MAG: bifunctional diaminohydroxyphosphoribosylaminopyrimidine deaminase/5-amino-6-(5-phosphoribosylamino)uracil reductase RibD [Rhodoglobus sp.]
MTAAAHSTTQGYEPAMRRALELATHGPATGVNPQVGCVLIETAGTVVAEGWHRGSGTAHAEVDALSALANTGPGSAHGLTAVVTLEPCNHTGQTGPCTEALIAANIARVVYAVSDPGHKSGGGAQRLQEAGIEVIAGVLAEQAGEFQRPWLVSTAKGRPFVTAKWASSLDGRVAAADGSSQWISGAAARQRVHEQRAASDAIVVGTGTVLADDPSLTARDEAGELRAAQPQPVVIGERSIPTTAKLREHPRGVWETRSRDLDAVLSSLFEQGIRRVFVEGGPTLTSAFIEAGLVDDYLIYLAPSLLGGDRLAVGNIGVTALSEARQLRVTSIESLGNDLLLIARPAEPTPKEGQ